MPVRECAGKPAAPAATDSGISAFIITPWQCYCSFKIKLRPRIGFQDCFSPFVVIKKDIAGLNPRHT
jgi:hypothetical protein